MDELLRDFLAETGEGLDIVNAELVRFEQEPENQRILDNVYRLVHTIKGNCGFLGLSRLGALTHAAETLLGTFRTGSQVSTQALTLILASVDRVQKLLDDLDRLEREPEGDDRDLIGELERMASATGTAARRTKPASRAREKSIARSAKPAVDAEATASRGMPPADTANSRVATQLIRVHVDTLEHIMTMVSELVLTRNQLNEMIRHHEDSEFKGPLQRLSNVTAELQDGVLKARMQPISSAWQKIPRLVRDLSSELSKPIELEMNGSSTELDRQVLDIIKDPLTHMVRNSAAHGIELPEERFAAGKPERGTISLSAFHQGGHIVIEVADDGRGLDLARIKAKAVALDLASEEDIEKMSDAQAQEFIFKAGFSTAGKVTKVSGRGVGMDVVRANINEIGGSIDVKSVAGCGTTFVIKIPLTLAIISALIVEVGRERFAIPQIAVAELVRASRDSEHRIEKIKYAAVMRLRSKLLPLVQLNTVLSIPSDGEAEAKQGFVVVTQVGSRKFGILVDRVLHTEEIVVKPVSAKLRHIAMFSGTTILGDGTVILIVDPNGVAQTIDTETTRRAEAKKENSAVEAGLAPAATETFLIFRAGSPALKAIPIALVTRLEEIDISAIEMSNGRRVVQYRGQLMPLVAADDKVRLKSDGRQPLLVFADEHHCMGLIVDEILDIVEDKLVVELPSKRPGVIGSAVIKGHATEILDIAHFLPLAHDSWHDKQKGERTKVKRKVLLVDDVPFFHNMLSPLLKAAGYAVTSVGSARDALALLADSRSFDVVVTDIDMPDMDGLQLATALRQAPHTAELPIIGLVSDVSAETVARGAQAGLHNYVAKFDGRGLITAVHEQTLDAPHAILNGRMK